MFRKVGNWGTEPKPPEQKLRFFLKWGEKTQCFCPAGLQSGTKANKLPLGFGWAGSVLSKGQSPIPCHGAACPSLVCSVPSGWRGWEQSHLLLPAPCPATKCSHRPACFNPAWLRFRFGTCGLGAESMRPALWYRKVVLAALMSRASPSHRLGPDALAVEPARCPWPQKPPSSIAEPTCNWVRAVRVWSWKRREGSTQEPAGTSPWEGQLGKGNQEVGDKLGKAQCDWQGRGERRIGRLMKKAMVWPKQSSGARWWMRKDHNMRMRAE